MSSVERLRQEKLISASEDIEFVDYEDETQLEHVMKLVIQDLSEPYSSKFGC